MYCELYNLNTHLLEMLCQLHKIDYMEWSLKGEIKRCCTGVFKQLKSDICVELQLYLLPVSQVESKATLPTILLEQPSLLSHSSYNITPIKESSADQ